MVPEKGFQSTSRLVRYAFIALVFVPFETDGDHHHVRNLEMADMSSVISAITRKSPEGEPVDIVGALAGLGSIFGIIAAAVGLFSGMTLVPLTSYSWELIATTPFDWIFAGSTQFPMMAGIFMGLLSLSLLLQALGSKELRGRLGGMLGNVFFVGFITAAIVAYFAYFGFEGVRFVTQVQGYLSLLYLVTLFFVISWQMSSVFIVDSSLSWKGFLSGIMNGLFIPLLALGHVLGPLITYAAYGVLLVGQLVTMLYWWSPLDTIRGYARSPEKAKFAFGLSGFLTFLIGTASIIFGPLRTHYTGAIIWYPWSTLVNVPSNQLGFHQLTDPILIYAFLAMMLFWILLSPRLGARELKTAAIGEDIVKGGSKWFAVFMVLLGLLAASQSGLYSADPGGWGFFLVIGPAAAMILMGSLYTAKTDIITGLPLIIAGIFIMVHPFSWAYLVLIPWIMVVVTQLFLAIESYWRGFTGFSQGALSVLISVLSSVALIGFILGLFGRGPLALWPTNLWFNINLLPWVSSSVQISAVIILPFTALIIRNSALAGFSHGRGYTTGGVLMGGTVLFSLFIPIIAGNVTVTHEASTGAAILIALYAISMFLILSLNLNLANDVIEKNHDFEGNLIKYSAIGQLVMGTVMLLLTLVLFSAIPNSTEIAIVVSVMVIFVVGSELLSIVGWLIAGARLGLLKQGFRIQRPNE